MTLDKPIIFSAPMVQALLDGEKTQTRRLVTWPVKSDSDGSKRRVFKESETPEINRLLACKGKHPNQCIKTPYGGTGDRIWVRETWRYVNWTEDGEPQIEYRADNTSRWIPDTDYSIEWGEKLADIWASLSSRENYKIDGRAADRKWRSPLFMPRWASRITLEITDIRIEKLCDISESDAWREGIHELAGEFEHFDGDPDQGRKVFRSLWESIHGNDSWHENPQVWVIEFGQVLANNP